MIIYKKRLVLVVCIVILLLLSVLGIWLKCSGRLDTWLMERKYKSSQPNCDCHIVRSQKDGRYYSPVASIENLYESIEQGIQLGRYTREYVDTYFDEHLFKCAHGCYFIVETAEEREAVVQEYKDVLAQFVCENLQISADYKTIYLYVTKENVVDKTAHLKRYYDSISTSCFVLQSANGIPIWDRAIYIHWIDSVTGKTIHTEKEVTEVQSNLDWDVPYDSFSSAQ